MKSRSHLPSNNGGIQNIWVNLWPTTSPTVALIRAHSVAVSGTTSERRARHAAILLRIACISQNLIVRGWRDLALPRHIVAIFVHDY
jgi:hypothetical protein